MPNWFVLTFGISTLSTVVSVIMLRRVLKQATLYCNCYPAHRRARRAVITGATSGIGLATAHELARRGWSLILACRNLEAASDIQKVLLERYNPPSIDVRYLDLADLSSISQFTKKLSPNESIDVLINNAGIMEGSRVVVPKFQVDTDMLVNFIGQFCLFQEILPFLKCPTEKESSFIPRVIFVSSALGARGTLHTLNRDLLKCLDQESWNAQVSYANSKQALNLCAQEIARRFGSGANRSLNVYTVVTGGMVNTSLSRSILGDLPSPARWFLQGLSRFILKSPEEGCQSIIHCAVSENVYGAHLDVEEVDSNEGSGFLYRNCCPVEWPDSSKSVQLAATIYSEAESIYHSVGRKDNHVVH